VAKHYASRTTANVIHDKQLLICMDHALSTFASSLPAGGVPQLTALVGLRCNLFPQVPFNTRVVKGMI